MKSFFGMMLLLAAAAGTAACVGAPVDAEEPTAATPQAEVGKPESTEAAQPAHEIEATTIGACTPAEFAACRKKDPYGSGCEILNGRVTCLFF